MPTLLFLHGNATSASGIAFLTKRFADAGWTIVVPEYPGYPGSTGTPSEAGLLDAAKIGWKVASAEGTPSTDILVVGNSIGSGPAIAIAAEQRPRGLAVVSGMAYLPDVIRTRFPFIPDALVKDAYDNVARMRDVTIPVMVVHGTADDLIPFPHGRRLAAAAGAPLVAVKGGHEIIAMERVQTEIMNRFEK